MCFPTPKMPDVSAQIKAQQEAVSKQKAEEQLAQRNAEMAQASATAKRLQRRRRGRASLITRSGGTGSLGILNETPTSTGMLRPLGENFAQLSNQ